MSLGSFCESTLTEARDEPGPPDCCRSRQSGRNGVKKQTDIASVEREILQRQWAGNDTMNRFTEALPSFEGFRDYALSAM